MSLHFNPTARRVTRYALEPHDLLTVGGVEYRAVSKTEAGYVVVRADGTGVAETFTNEHLSQLVAAGDLKHERGKFLPASAQRSAEVRTEFISATPAEQNERTQIRAAFVEAFFEMKDEGLVCKQRDSIKFALPAMEAEAANFLTDFDPSKKGRKLRGGDRREVFAAPNERTLRRWLKKHEQFGMAGLVDKWAMRGNRSRKMSMEAIALMMESVRGFATREKPTQKKIFDDVCVAFHDENIRREAAGLCTLRCPSRETVRQAIKKLDPFYVDIQRLGLERARRKNAPVGRGLDLTRPLQRVEMDEWKIDLISLMTESGLLAFFDKDDRARLGLDGSKDRWWVSVAICTTSKCLLGMKLARNPTTSLAIETLQMSMQDKGVFADAAGALSPWDMAGKGELYVTDCGNAYKDKRFRTTCADLSIRTERAIAGLPQMRGTVERFFRTASIGLLPRLTGRTFSNIIERGDYKSEDCAALTADELALVLVRWIVDIYHNTPHAGLNGDTPAEAWQRLNREWGVLPPPDLRANRLVFGTRLERVVGNAGITVLGVRYHSENLARWMAHARDKTVALRWWPNDLGAIEVNLNGEWHTVEAVFDGFSGLHAQTWLAAARRLRTEQKARRKITDVHVIEAIKAIEGVNRAAKKRADLIVADWSAEWLQHEEDRLFIGFNVSAQPARTPDVVDSLGMVLNAPLAGTSASASIDDVDAAPVASLPRRGGDASWTMEE